MRTFTRHLFFLFVLLISCNFSFSGDINELFASSETSSNSGQNTLGAHSDNLSESGLSWQYPKDQYIPGTCSPAVNFDTETSQPPDASAKKSGPGQEGSKEMNGNGSINTSFVFSACGLNYTSGSVVLLRRPTSGPPIGGAQPATISIAGIPTCAIIERAFLYADASGNGVAITATVRNPGGTTSNFPMTHIGQHIDKCWSFAGSHSYRADVTSIITTNGAYAVSGLPTSTAAGPNDVDGATLIIIYRDPNQTYTGTLVLADGAHANSTGGALIQDNISGFTACGASTSANAFMIISDLQGVGNSAVTLNNTAYTQLSTNDRWWNFIVTATTVTAGQNTSRFTIRNPSDCYNIVAEGLYFQANCLTCVPPTLTVSVNTSLPCNPTFATATASGGTAPYTYTWSNGMTGPTISGVPPGNYTVTVRDANNCLTRTVPVTIPPNTPPTISVNSPTICSGNSVVLSASGASTYTWTGGLPNGASVTTPILNSTTSYTVTGTDVNGCINTAVATVTVNPTPTVSVNSPTICASNSVVLTASGANTYTWTGGLPNGASVTTPILNNTISYTVTGTAANGCSNTALATVTVNPLPPVNVNSPSICTGFSTTLNASGASSYTWTGGLPANASVTTPVLTSTTSYTVTGTDANGCINSAVATVTVNPLPNVGVNSPVICAGNTAGLTASGASAYTWTGGLPNGANVTTPVLNSTTSYTVTGTDINGCVNTAVSTITVNPNPTVNVNSPTICAGNTVGLSATGASNYTWTGGLPNGSNVTTPILNNTTSYTVTGTDGNGCSGTAVATVTVNPLPSVSVNSPSICTGNSVGLNASGAAGYSWTGGLPPNASVTTPVLTATTSYTVTGTGANGCTNSAVATVTVNPLPNVGVNSPVICAGNTTNLSATGATTYTWTGGLPNGANVTTPVLNSTTSYIVTGTDVNGCVNTAISNVTVNPNPTVSVNSPTICAGNTVGLSATGASNYTWTGGLPNGSNVTTPILNNTTSYTVTGTDGNGCSNAAVSTVTVNPLPSVSVNSPSICSGNSVGLNASGAAGYSWTGGLPPNASVTTPVLTATTSYTVTGTGANGCTNTAVATVTVNPLPIVGVNSPVICAGNSTGLTATGATTYTWTGGLPNGANVTTPVLNSTTSYTVTGTDVNGCVNSAVSTVTVNQNPVVSVNSPTICSGETATLNASGANSYTWTGGLPNGASVTTPVLNNSTSYTVTGTDGNGCRGTATSTVTVTASPLVTVNSSVICIGQSTVLTANGADTYSWSTGASGSSINVSPSGTTSYTVTGLLTGCSIASSATATVTVNPLPNVGVNSPVICAGNSTGLTATGASTYTWTGGLPNGANVTTPVLNSTTSYTVTGTDANGCINTAVSTVTVNPNPVVSVNSPTICSGETATLNAAGAGAGTYSWTGGLPNGASVTTPILNNNTSYTVTGTDVNGCMGTAISNVTVTPSPAVSVNSSVICFGQNTQLTASGADTYSWSTGASGASINVSPGSTTSYTVTGLLNGCSVPSSATATVTVHPLPTVTVNSPSICSGKTASLSASGASNYTWTGGLPNGANVTTQVLTATTTYTVTGTDGNGCVNTAISRVTVNPLPNVTVSSPVICFGQTANINANGASTYTWTGGLSGGANVTTPVLNFTTTYTVTGTDGNGCENTAVSTVTVNPLPIVTVNSPAICTGFRTTLTAGGANIYTWSGGLPNGANVNTPVLYNSTAYTVTGTDGNGCVNTAVSNVTVYQQPTVSVNSPTICAGQTATLSANGASTYTWSGGLPAGNSVNTPVLNNNASYTVIGTDVNTCKDTAIAFVTVNPVKATNVRQTICDGQTVTIGGQSFPSTGIYTVALQTSLGCDSIVTLDLTVKPRLLVDVSVTPSQNDICSGSPVTFTATPANEGTTPQYQWYLNGNPVGANSPIYSNSQLNNGDEIFVQLTSSEMCTQVNPAFSERIPMIVNKLDYIKPHIEYCAGEGRVLDLSVLSTPSNRYSVIWNNNGDIHTTENADQMIVENGASGYIGFTLQYGNGCEKRDTLNFTVNPLPVINATVDRTLVKYLEEVQLDVQGGGTLTYSWITAAELNDPLIRNPIGVITAPAWFEVTATDPNGCRRTDSVFVDMIDECFSEFVFVPSGFTPNNDGLNDCFGVLYAPPHTEFKLVVFDRWGERLFETDDVSKCWDGNYKGVNALMDGYSYVVGFRCYNGKFIMKKGIVTLVR